MKAVVVPIVVCIVVKCSATIILNDVALERFSTK